MRKALWIAVLCLMASGCDVERMNRLEKENGELKAEVQKLEKKTASTDLGTQEKCSKGAKEWFNENFISDKKTLLLTFTNHYNAQDNHCYILVEKHYSVDANGSWTNLMLLYDVYENSKYGVFGGNTTVFFKPEYHTGEEVSTCELLNQKCKTIDEFSNLVRPYLSN
jgi:hypothetical protein